MALSIIVPAATETYRITSDIYNFTVERRVFVDPTKSPRFDASKHDSALREEWREPKYFGTLEKALKSLLERKARDSDATTLDALIKELRDFRYQINDLIDGDT